MSGTILKPCNCASPYQDQIYGKGIRLHNIDSTDKKASCTVCEGSARYARRNSKSSPPTTNRSSKSI